MCEASSSLQTELHIKCDAGATGSSTKAGDPPTVWTEKTVLLKSELGKAAIAQRLPALPIRLRPVLILVDGKRTVGELGRMLDSLGGMAALNELHTLGMLEVPAASAPAEATAASVPSAEAPGNSPSTLSFADYAKAVGQYFGRELGPNGQILVLQIGAATDMRALKPLVDRGLDNLKYFKGPAAVAQFQTSLGQQAPR